MNRRLRSYLTYTRLLAIFLAWCAVCVMAVLALAVVALAIAVVQAARM